MQDDVYNTYEYQAVLKDIDNNDYGSMSCLTILRSRKVKYYHKNKAVAEQVEV